MGRPHYEACVHEACIWRIAVLSWPHEVKKGSALVHAMIWFQCFVT